jgi:predicted RNA-binding protein
MRDMRPSQHTAGFWESAASNDIFPASVFRHLEHFPGPPKIRKRRPLGRFARVPSPHS